MVQIFVKCSMIHSNQDIGSWDVNHGTNFNSLKCSMDSSFNQNR